MTADDTDPTKLTTLPIFKSVAELRAWRHEAFITGKSIGLVPTMGALHEGHLSLVRRALASNDLTVVSIFVNPTQFGPNEDLASYPRTLAQDLALLESLAVPSINDANPIIRKVSGIFLPTVDEMYPSSSAGRDMQLQTGTFVEVKGYGDRLEGTSRPSFFRGVATVVTKLFNAVQPDNAYFGQKDIQQALILKRMARDLLLSMPSHEAVHIVPTARDPNSNLALSSRNSYLSIREREYAATLYAALQAGERAWSFGGNASDVISAATHIFKQATKEAISEGIQIRLDYIKVSNSETFEDVKDDVRGGDEEKTAILSGAVWYGRARLIDNIILGDKSRILS